MKKLRIVFDVDDTICHNDDKLPYDQCVPDRIVIDKINKMKEELDCEVVLFTARGMVSCDGDMDKIIKKNKKVLEDWLHKHKVMYDELIFGKPIGDLYVDDKAMHIDDFVDQSFEVLSGGGSGKPTIKMGKVVVKELGSDEDMLNFKLWMKDGEKVLTNYPSQPQTPSSFLAPYILSKSQALFPRVHSWLYNTMYMDYIYESINLSSMDKSHELEYNIEILLNYIDLFSKVKQRASGLNYLFDVNEHIDILKLNYVHEAEFYDEVLINHHLDNCIRLLDSDKSREILNANASFSHGDMILSNVLLTKKWSSAENLHGYLYLIDARYQPSASSYLLDYAKLRMSLHDYEYTFGLSAVKISEVLAKLSTLQNFDNVLRDKGIYDIVIILHYMYLCRLYRYKTEGQKQDVINLIERLVEENEALLESV